MDKGKIGPHVPPAARAHLEWIRQCMRDNRMCIDGGTCHHQCNTRRVAEVGPGHCFRMEGYMPLSGSGLDDNWNLADPGAPARAPDPRPPGKVFHEGWKVRILAGSRAGHEGRVLWDMGANVYEVGIVGIGFVTEDAVNLHRIPEFAQ